MERLSVFVWVLVVSVVHFRGGRLLNSCQELCCFTPTNRTELDRNFENTNNDTPSCKKCLQKQRSEANVTQQQLCPEQQINTTNSSKEVATSLCQQIFDEATNDFVGLVKGIKVHFNRMGSFWYINITWDAFDDPQVSYKWSHYFVQWLVSQERTDCGLISKNKTFFIINETEDGWKYPKAIHLNVSTYPLKDTGYVYRVMAYPPRRGHIKIPATLPSKVSTEMVAAIIIGSCIGLILVTMLLVAWKLRFPHGWRAKYGSRIKSLSQNEGNFEYDASILYSSLDEKWVTEELIPLLESENNFKCFIHFRDYEAGKVIHENMADSVYKCRKNLAVVSENFLKSGYCKTELDMALERVNRCGDYSLIVVNLDGVSINLLPKSLRIRTFVNLTSSQEQKTWKNRLVKQISVDEDKQGSIIKAEEFLHVTAKGCQVISHINEIKSTSAESV